MRCCGTAMTSVTVKVGGEDLVMHHCDRCDTRQWERAGEVIDVDALTDALREERDARRARREAGQRGRR